MSNIEKKKMKIYFTKEEMEKIIKIKEKMKEKSINSFLTKNIESFLDSYVR